MADAKVDGWRLKNWLTEHTSGRYFYATSADGPGRMPLPLAPAPGLPAGLPPDSEQWQRNALAREVAAAIARHRAVYDLSPKQLADQLGWDVRKLNNLETGQRLPTIATLLELSTKLGWKLHIEVAPRRGITYPDISLKVANVPAALPRGS